MQRKLLNNLIAIMKNDASSYALDHLLTDEMKTDKEESTWLDISVSKVDINFYFQSYPPIHHVPF